MLLIKLKQEKIQKDQKVSVSKNHHWNTGTIKCTCWHIFRTSVNWKIPALSSNECYSILLIIHWLLNINYLYILYYTHNITAFFYNSLEYTFFFLGQKKLLLLPEMRVMKKPSPGQPQIIFLINLTEFYWLNVYHYGFKKLNH